MNHSQTNQTPKSPLAETAFYRIANSHDRERLNVWLGVALWIGLFATLVVLGS